MQVDFSCGIRELIFGALGPNVTTEQDWHHGLFLEKDK